MKNENTFSQKRHKVSPLVVALGFAAISALGVGYSLSRTFPDSPFYHSPPPIMEEYDKVREKLNKLEYAEQALKDVSVYPSIDLTDKKTEFKKRLSEIEKDNTFLEHRALNKRDGIVGLVSLAGLFGSIFFTGFRPPSYKNQRRPLVFLKTKEY